MLTVFRALTLFHRTLPCLLCYRRRTYRLTACSSLLCLLSLGPYATIIGAIARRTYQKGTLQRFSLFGKWFPRPDAVVYLWSTYAKLNSLGVAHLQSVFRYALLNRTLTLAEPRTPRLLLMS